MMRTIMITGAAHGMGHEVARRAIARGDRVIATVLPGENAETLGDHANLTVVEIDVGLDESVAAAFEAADRALQGVPLDIVVNCAGISPSGALEVEPTAMLERVLNTNTVGSARIIKHSLPRLRGHRGRILLFSSLWGRVAGPMLSAYCASKHATEAIVDSTRREIRGQDVDIVLIEPGVVRTNMVAGTISNSRAGADHLPEKYRALYGDIYDKFARMIAREATGGVSVEQAANVIERAAFAARPKTRYKVGKDAKAVIALTAILPDRTFDVIFNKVLDR